MHIALWLWSGRGHKYPNGWIVQNGSMNMVENVFILKKIIVVFICSLYFLFLIGLICHAMFFRQQQIVAQHRKNTKWKGNKSKNKFVTFTFWLAKTKKSKGLANGCSNSMQHVWIEKNKTATILQVTRHTTSLFDPFPLYPLFTSWIV